MNHYDVTPLTEAGYEAMRDAMRRTISLPPDELFAIVEDAREVVIRSVLGAMSEAGSVPPIEGLTDHEIWIVYDILDLVAQGRVMDSTVQVDLEPGEGYAALAARYGTRSDPLAAFSGPEAPRFLSVDAGSGLGVGTQPEVAFYLVVERPAN